MRQVSFTFDIDCIDYSTGQFIDEAVLYVPSVLEDLENIGLTCTTWFVRIDAGQESRYENFDKFLEATKSLVDVLVESGHLVGWHHHSTGSKSQEESELLDDLAKYGQIAREFGLEMFRSGFGQMTTAMIRELIALGFNLDSSCMSRPNYSWTNVPLRDWSSAPNHPYFPCKNDYQRACDCQRNLLEVPITTVRLELETDTQPGVLRYLNPAYPVNVFRRGVDDWLGGESGDGCLVTITHPFETQRDPSSGYEGGFVDNLQYVLDSNIRHVPLNGII